MTNREWLLNKMQNMSDEELGKGVADSGLMVVLLGCAKENERCRRFDGCNSCVINWLKSEHKEKITLSEAEHTILEDTEETFGWICRDRDGDLYIYAEKPIKRSSNWADGIKSNEFVCFNHLFQFIKWEDEQAYNIEELLKEG